MTVRGEIFEVKEELKLDRDEKLAGRIEKHPPVSYIIQIRQVSAPNIAVTHHLNRVPKPLLQR